MKAVTYLILTHDEVNEQIPYAVVAETMGSARWNTGRRRRLMKQRFTESEIESIYELHKKAYD